MYLLFVWMEYKKQIKKVCTGHFAECQGHSTLQKNQYLDTGIASLPSVVALALGKEARFAECHCRGP
jgi:hypothetical protein